MDPFSSEPEKDASLSQPHGQPPEVPIPDIEFLDGSAPVYVTDVRCWRCHLSYAETLIECSHCGAKNRNARPQEIQFEQDAPTNLKPLKVVLVTYGLMLAGSILMALFVRFGMDPAEEDASAFTGAILCLEIVDTIIVLVAMGMTGLAFARIDPVPSPTFAASCWLIFIIALPVAILGNIAYHNFLLELLNIPKAEEVLPDSWIVLLVLFCVQPAIIEELFSRQMSLAVFREIMGVHFSIFITALMFAMMHIFVPLSVPYLFVLGVFLGYSRVWGGTVFLPMVLHFAHNLIVLIYEKM